MKAVLKLACVALVPAIAACASSSPSPSPSPTPSPAPAPAPSPSPAPTQDTLASLAAGTALAMTANQGLVAVTITNGAAVDAGTAFPAVTVQSAPTSTYTKTATGFTLTLPSGSAVTYNTTAGNPQVTGTQEFTNTLTGGTNRVETTLTNGAASTLTYSTYGTWVEESSTSIPLTVGTLIAGVATTTAQMPTTGTATYSGNATGIALNSVTSAAATIESGTVALSANFAANSLTGSISAMVTRSIGNENGPAGTINGLTFSGGTISGNSFSGTAAAAAATGTPTVLITGATGTFGGKFYGPAAAEALGSFNLTGTGINVFGVFGTKKN